MTWSFTNVAIQIITGILGGHAAAAVVKEHSFGLLGHTIAGAIGGATSGYFLQTIAVNMVTAGGSLNDPTLAENVVIQGLTGAVVGGCVMLIVGLVKHGIDEHKRKKG
jgi:uncharacterized membrane protein YeaQ/YmgE (transglycosylase-associated protein family)